MFRSWVWACAVGVLVAGCTGGGEPDQAQGAVPATVCDIVTGAMAAGALGIGVDEVTDGGCLSAPVDGVASAKVWRTEPVALTTYVTTDLKAFADLSVHQCKAEAGTRGCVVTGDSYAVLLEDKAVVTSIGVDPALRVSRVPKPVELLGAHLADFTAEVVTALRAGRTVPQAVTPTPTSVPAPPPPTRAPDPDQVNRGRCSLHIYGGERCSSLDATASFEFNSTSQDTSHCTYEGELDFGDGSRQAWSITGRLGLITMAEHTYTAPGTYSVTTTARGAGGRPDCPAVGGRYTFTLEPPPTPATCDTKFADDRGRAYMYTLLPQGTLRGPDGQPAKTFTPEGTLWFAGPTYTDDAGVRWTLQSFGTSVYHVPPGWPADSDADPPFRKFVSENDSRGGSFEAVLMPDGVRPGAPFSTMRGKTWTYNDLNWLIHGPGMPTYNYSSANLLLGHYVYDVFPHDHLTPDEMDSQGRPDDRYVIPTHLVDPAKGNWRTYRARFVTLRDEILEDGARFDPSNGTVTSGGPPRQVDTDLLWAAAELAECAGR